MGFDHSSARVHSSTQNMQSALRNPGPVVAYLEAELAADRIVGPFEADEVPLIQVSRFGLIPKSNQPGEWRLILDLSSPLGFSVNDGVDPALCSLQYATVDQAVGYILSLGKGALLAKIDIKHAYRNIPVHPEDRHLLGMCWHGKVFIDTTFPFGLRSAPKIFCSVADALAWILQKQGVSWSMHYIDDFLTAGKPQSSECANNLKKISDTCLQLGTPLKLSKLEGPTTILPFLGITLDTERQEIRLPQNKTQELRSLLATWSQKGNCRKRELLSLIGKLSHACKVVCVGRSFLRRLIDRACKAKCLDHWGRGKS